MHENKDKTESREPKDLNSCSTNGSDQLNNSGHGVCEYIGATHSSQHTASDAKHSSTCCCPTHEMWELPIPLIVANRSQQGEELARINITDASNNSTEAYTATHNIHAQFNAVKQAHIHTSSLLSYNYYKEVPSNTDLTPAKPNTDTSSGTVAQKLRIGSYELSQICPTLLTQQKKQSHAYANRLHKGDVFAIHLQLNASFQKRYQTKRLSKRSPALPLTLQSKLSTIGNRRRHDISADQSTNHGGHYTYEGWGHYPVTSHAVSVIPFSLNPIDAYQLSEGREVAHSTSWQHQSSQRGDEIMVGKESRPLHLMATPIITVGRRDHGTITSSLGSQRNKAQYAMKICSISKLMQQHTIKHMYSARPCSFSAIPPSGLPPTSNWYRNIDLEEGFPTAVPMLKANQHISGDLRKTTTVIPDQFRPPHCNQPQSSSACTTIQLEHLKIDYVPRLGLTYSVSSQLRSRHCQLSHEDATQLTHQKITTSTDYTFICAPVHLSACAPHNSSDRTSSTQSKLHSNPLTAYNTQVRSHTVNQLRALYPACSNQTAWDALSAVESKLRT
ncbi:flavonol synthase/flavanone 3-hydroxylase [Dorcoceras hygrometricum]|uniref:Flavonol synthase/flavanone 3-hydroxylase n=1 Tax=Dorcoceras hygrometricum TaxID=472368 RepID=A0A2Z7AP68_9LAMI|nr:flavonol synthase/flavanone 3-hydroxylase [Dorcoceras hygrometricum]